MNCNVIQKIESVPVISIREFSNKYLMMFIEHFVYEKIMRQKVLELIAFAEKEKRKFVILMPQKICCSKVLLISPKGSIILKECRDLNNAIIKQQNQLLFFPISFGKVVKKDVIDSEHKFVKKNDNITIFIDPGHGGENLGGHSFGNKYQEKNFTLITSQFAKQLLREIGYNVFVSRVDDTDVGLDARVNMAEKMQATIFVSIHYNAAENREANGIEVFHFNKDTFEQSKLLAENIIANTTKITQVNSRGVKVNDFRVIKNTTMPSILLEAGFMTNEVEMQKIYSSSYMQKVAAGIAQGINDYFNTSRR